MSSYQNPKKAVNNFWQASPLNRFYLERSTSQGSLNFTADKSVKSTTQTHFLVLKKIKDCSLGLFLASCTGKVFWQGYKRKCSLSMNIPGDKQYPSPREVFIHYYQNILGKSSQFTSKVMRARTYLR